MHDGEISLQQGHCSNQMFWSDSIAIWRQLSTLSMVIVGSCASRIRGRFSLLITLTCQSVILQIVTAAKSKTKAAAVIVSPVAGRLGSAYAQCGRDHHFGHHQ